MKQLRAYSAIWKLNWVFLGSHDFCEEGDIFQAWLKGTAAAAKSLQSCPTLCNPIDGSPPGFSVPGILQARILEWIVISFSDSKEHWLSNLIPMQIFRDGKPLSNHSISQREVKKCQEMSSRVKVTVMKRLDIL